MPKILLVEDDNNLREIFQMRLQAEGYATAVAADGEEGLVVAMKEKPDLVIADVMMPKLSGFEMIENLRSSPEMKDTKVIMMTALGQAEDQARGEKLGVVKYLVKSQVTLEDFARVVKEVLGPGDPNGAAAATPAAQATTNSQESEDSMQDPSNPTPMPNSDAPSGDQSAGGAPTGGSMPTGDGQQSTSQEQTVVNDQVNTAMGGAPDASGAGTDSPVPADDTAGTAPAMPTSDSGSSSTDTNPAPMPPASEPPADPSAPPADTGPAGPPTDPTSNAL
jgi:CheY-like chemotaxis protein